MRVKIIGGGERVFRFNTECHYEWQMGPQIKHDKPFKADYVLK
jgi:hypothetical protein